MWTNLADTHPQGPEEGGRGPAWAPSETITRWDDERDLTEYIFDAERAAGRADRQRLNGYAAADRAGVWLRAGHRDMAEWVAANCGISKWKARRMVAAGHALERLPRLARALESGELSLDKTIELARFATPDTEEALVRWARRVIPATVRERADAALAKEIDVKKIERSRYLEHWNDGAGSHHFQALLPAADGAVVAKAIERLAARLPDSPEDPADNRPQKRADALVALAAIEVGSDQDPDRATVVVHTTPEMLRGADEVGAQLEDGSAIHPETGRRLACECRLEEVDWADDEARRIAGIRDAGRSPRPALRRAVLRRDNHCCTFPGCEARAFLETHHQRWRARDYGPTDEDNLALACRIHHKLVHEFGWDVVRTGDGVVWLRPDGTPYLPGPQPSKDPGPDVIEVAKVPSWIENLAPPDPAEILHQIADYLEFGIRPRAPSSN